MLGVYVMMSWEGFMPQPRHRVQIFSIHQSLMAAPTSRSMIFNSQDGERSMNTYLGISGDLSVDDIPTNLASRAAFVFLEGYLFDKNKGKEAFVKLAEIQN